MVLKSETLLLNKKIAKSFIDFKNYFQYSIDLKFYKQNDHLTGGNNYSLGSFFKFKNYFFMLKIKLHPDKKFVFKIGAIQFNNEENNEENDILKISEFILNNMIFLFKN